MKWLLITGIRCNPGDELIRMGIERLVRAADPAAEFDYVCKVDKSTWTPRPFDRAILCGMPLFWDEESTWSDSMDWWPLITGWPAVDKRNIMALGVGSCCSTQATGRNAKRFVAMLQERMWRIVMRDTFIRVPGVEYICCPGVFALDSRLQGRSRLVNLMPNGGGWDEFNMAEASVWRRRYDETLKLFLEAGWTLVAHDKSRMDHALQSGWTGPRVLADNIKTLVETYADCGWYFGNRVHGAVAAISAGGSAWNVGYDSRRFTVDAVGGMSCLPSEMNLSEVEEYANLRIVPRHPCYGFDRIAAFARYDEILREFTQ